MFDSILNKINTDAKDFEKNYKKSQLISKQKIGIDSVVQEIS